MAGPFIFHCDEPAEAGKLDAERAGFRALVEFSKRPNLASRVQTNTRTRKN